MGIKKPIPEFVVAPKIVIASPILGTNMAIAHEKATIPNVHKVFCLKLNLSPFINNSSKLSLDGKTQNGAAKVTTISTPNRHILITM